MNGASTNAYDVMIALINTFKPSGEVGANEVAKMYEVLMKKIQEI